MPSRETTTPDSLSKDDKDKNDAANRLLKREIDCLQLVKERTSVPIPAVYGYSTNQNKIGPSFMLTECLPGNVGMLC
jgi:hypothetical protein